MKNAPHSPEAESALLGCCILAERIVDEAADFMPADFAVPTHAVVWEAMLSLRTRRRALDVVSLENELSALGLDKRVPGNELVRMAGSVATFANAKHYADIVRGHSQARRLIMACADTMARLQGGDSVELALPDHRATVAKLDVSKGGGPVRLGDALHGVMEVLDQRQADPIGYGVPTGIGKFDRVIGTLKPGRLYVIGGQPGMGKTSLLDGWAMHAARRRSIPTLVFSLEMTLQELAERYLSAEGRIEGARVSSGDLDMEGWNKVSQAAEKLADVPLWIDERVQRVSSLCASARAWYEALPVPAGGSKVALIGVDYLQLARPDSKDDSREQQVSEMTRALKELAKELNVPVVLLSQLNRKSSTENRKPEMHDLRDSGGIEANADMVLFPWREPPLDRSGPALLLVRKHRGGPIGDISVFWHAETMTFENLEDRLEQEASDHGNE